ncbi:Acetyltransferase (GNAT) domain protein [Melia azedarach]|uniref:Acetyltransferase (GNAT) domain protein n=1 Tax=Melia azedarach TaxID=155640 RepID=A0ACC1YH20_MELAZ|nr:Acetyltransferase (GNAT) domain protein [Melia azedarach]
MAICLNNNGQQTNVEVNSGTFWPQSTATRAVKMVVDTIFTEWPHLERLEALVDVENVGFLQEGVLRKYYIQKGKTIDMIMFSLLSTDPR